MLDTIKEAGEFLIENLDLMITLLVIFGVIKTKDIMLVSGVINNVIRELEEGKFDKGNKTDFIRTVAAGESKLTYYNMQDIIKEKIDGSVAVDKKELVKHILGSGDFKKAVRKVGKWVRKL